VQRREGPYRFIQNRSWASAAALKSDAAAEKPKDQLWRDFSGCSIFDFCNKIGQERKSSKFAPDAFSLADWRKTVIVGAQLFRGQEG
jgi:hypothetical protein